MAEPTLSEISNIASDPERSGIAPEPVIDNSKAVEQLNSNARFHAEQVAKKYDTFLQNKKDLYQNISDIQGLETLPEDRDVLHKQAADIFSDILNNPSVITGGKGYNELQAKIAGFKSSAMASKQAQLDEHTNKLFIDATPEVDTPENRAAIEAEKNKPIGARKNVLLKTPTILDQKSLFEGILKDPLVSNDYSRTFEKDGKHYIESGKQINPNALLGSWNQVVKGGQVDKYGHDLAGAVKFNYDKLPKDQKEEYEKDGGGGIAKFWEDTGQNYVNAYTQGLTKDEDGIYRFGKTTKLDPAYIDAEKLQLERQKLDEKTSNDKSEREIGWARIGVDKDKLNKTKKEDQDGAATVINEAVSTIKNGKPINVVDERTGKTHQEITISDPTLLQTFGTVDKTGKTTHVPDGMRYNPETNQVTLLYGKSNNTGGLNTHKEIPLDQRTWLKVITKRSYPNKDIGGVNSLIEDVLQANKGSLYEISQKESQSTPAADTKGKTQSYKIRGKSYSNADLKKLGYTDEQIQQAIKLGNIQ